MTVSPAVTGFGVAVTTAPGEASAAGALTAASSTAAAVVRRRVFNNCIFGAFQSVAGPVGPSLTLSIGDSPVRS